MLSAVQVPINHRAVKDEMDLQGYCLNCVKKHTASAWGLLEEVQMRIEQGNPITDKKVSKKMWEVFVQIVHIEQHATVPEFVDSDTRDRLLFISQKANTIRALIKSQNWHYQDVDNKPTGSVDDLITMRKYLSELNSKTDSLIVSAGCGDCTLDKFRTEIVSDSRAPIVKDSFIDNNLDTKYRGNKMSQIDRVVNTVFRSYSGIADGMFSQIGIDGQNVSSALFSNIVGSLAGVTMDTLLNPGFSLFAETLAGLGMMWMSSKYIRSGRAKMEWTNVGAFMFTRFLRSGVAELSQATSQLGSLSRMALSNPRAALEVPFRTPGEIQSIIESKTQVMGGLSPARLLGRSTALRQVIVPSIENESPISPNREFKSY